MFMRKRIGRASKKIMESFIKRQMTELVPERGADMRIPACTVFIIMKQKWRLPKHIRDLLKYPKPIDDLQNISCAWNSD